MLLRGLTGKRGELARCMAFSLEHAESASEVRPQLAQTNISIETDWLMWLVIQVADIIIRSLVVPSTPVPRKIARLHLICDILHNSAASISNAWKFRSEFESRLGSVFDHLCEIYKSFPGRITAETFKKQVLGVVEVWEDWIVFGPEFTGDLRRRLDGKEEEGGNGERGKDGEGKEREEKKVVGTKFKAAAFGAVVDEPVVVQAENLDGENLDGEDLDGENMDGDNIDGDNIDGENIDGDDIDGENLDGEDIAPKDIDGEDIDGAQMDDIDGEDIDGEDLRGKVERVEPKEGGSGDEMEMDSD